MSLKLKHIPINNVQVVSLAAISSFHRIGLKTNNNNEKKNPELYALKWAGIYFSINTPSWHFGARTFRSVLFNSVMNRVLKQWPWNNWHCEQTFRAHDWHRNVSCNAVAVPQCCFLSSSHKPHALHSAEIHSVKRTSQFHTSTAFTVGSQKRHARERHSVSSTLAHIQRKRGLKYNFSMKHYLKSTFIGVSYCNAYISDQA